MLTKIIVSVVAAGIFSSTAYAGDRELLGGILGFLIAGAIHSSKQEAHLPRDRDGFHYESINSRSARTHCPIVEHIVVYNRYGEKQEYLVRDCRR